MQFEWDTEKAETNLKKHKIDFSEAETVFGDPTAKIFDDEAHSFEEKREIIVGHSVQNRLLIICFTERENDTVRIISARLTTSQERRDYENAG
jgi:uncharacterized DUF497 family protein